MAQQDKPLKTIRRLRWWIVWTLFCSTVINYIDRQTLSVLAPVITKQFHMSHEDYSHIVSAFQIAYAGMWLIGGVLIDVIGTRLGLTLAMIWWSISSMLPSLANSVFEFSLFRFLLGMGEGCNWPGASKTVAEWFPARERGLAVAIFDSGSSVGAVIAPPFVAFIAYHFGWRFSFLTAGSLGFLWLILWLSLYQPLRSHPRLGDQERALIESGRDTAAASTARGVERFLGLLKQRNVWGIVLGRSLTDPIWWFYVFWLPQYLSDAHGFSLKQIGAFAWIPFLAADIGNFTGGFASGFLIRRGHAVIRSRKWVCVVSALPILAGIPAARAQSAGWALALISLATWGYASWSTMGLTFPSDLFPQDVVASVTGLSGLGAGLVSTVFTLAVGFLVDKFSYFPAFVAAGTIPLIATACVLLLIRAPQSAKSPKSGGEGR
ncbi:MAG TPA: MFS transporter [Terriglobia bacterium]|nr:MFS transporter [Terriglobia bacterium]